MMEDFTFDAPIREYGSIREYSSTLYVGLARAKLPVNFFTNPTSGGSL